MRNSKTYLSTFAMLAKPIRPVRRQGIPHSMCWFLYPTISAALTLAHKQQIRENVLRSIRERTPYGDVTPHIQRELIITPEDWEQKYSVFLGATFNMSHSWDQMLYLRPHNKFEEFSHCYLVGGGTHPGSGLPTIFESARIS